MTDEKKNANEVILQNVYQGAKMGTDAIAKLLPKVKSDKFKQAMATQLNGYQTFMGDACTRLTAINKTPEDVSIVQRLPSELGMIMGTAMDKSDSKIAEMMINGSVMGITEIKKSVAGKSGVPEETMKLAQDVITFEENNINKMKSFL